MKLLFTIILALALAVLLRSAGYFLRLATQGRSWHHYSLRVYPWIEVLAWLAFAFWAVENFFARSQIYPVAMGALAVAVVSVLGWFVLRELIAGAMVRADQALDTGVHIKTPQHEGVVTHLGYVSLELLTEEGEKIKIPYTSLTGKSISRKPPGGQGKNQCLKLKVQQKYGAGHIQQSLRRKVLELPWVVAGHEVKVQLTPSGKDYLVEVLFKSIRDEMLSQTQEVIMDYVSSEFPEA